MVNDIQSLTELLFDHLQDLFLVELLGQTLDCGQGLTTITFCCHIALAIQNPVSEGNIDV